MTEQEILWQAELDKATLAYAQKRYGDARAHCKAAKRQGAPSGTVQRLEKAIRIDEEHQAKLGKNSGWVGFLLTACAYGLLSFLPVSVPVRFSLALLVIPALCGFAMGRLIGSDAGTGSRFRRAARISGGTMFAYALLSMIWRRTRFELGGDAGQIFLLWLLAAVIYALGAAVVAGVVSAKLTGFTEERKPAHGTAS